MRPLVVLAALVGSGLAATAPASTDLLPAKIADYAKVVESVRGHSFDHPVSAVQIDVRELKNTLRDKLGESFPASPEDTLRSLVALGLIEETPHLLDRLVDFYASQVIAFYDPESRRFSVVTGGAALGDAEGLDGAAESLIYTHELTHALQDQNLGLDAKMKALKDDGDRALALQSLLEGEATVVMIKAALRDLPGDGEQAEDELAPLLSAGALEKESVPKDVPAYFTEQLFFPYVDGTAYVRRALKAGGWPAVDRLWRNPPLSTAEILHPEAPPRPPAAGLLPSATAPLAPSGFRPLYSDTMGEWGLRFLLRRGLEGAEADPAAAGWRGDRVAFFARPDGTIAYVWRVRMDSAASAGRLETALRKSRKANPTPRTEAALQEGSDLILAGGFPSDLDWKKLASLLPR